MIQKKSKLNDSVNKPIISKEDANLIFKTAKSGWVSSAGPEIKIFENKFKNLIGKNIPPLSPVGLRH